MIALNKERVVGTVILPASKSISNRVLILAALSGNWMSVENLSDSDDTRVLFDALTGATSLINVGQAGTAMRFLTAYFALGEGCKELTGSERMKQRPIGILVDALRELGARVEYAEKEGFPPVRVYGSSLQGGKTLCLDASVSSQYLSALMMIAPRVKGGVTICLKGKVVSADYIFMTAEMMRRFGVEVQIEKDRVVIPEQGYTPVVFRVEEDWSAASYFYEMLAVVGKGEIELPGLQVNSVQGDARQCSLWEQLGVRTVEDERGVRLSTTGKVCDFFEADFTRMPDVVLSFVVACCLKNIPFHVKGLETLSIKESDRVMALSEELSKLGYVLSVPVHGELCWNRERNTLIALEIDTYQDHRMAMAFAAVGLVFPGLVIRDAQVVAKSFPGFWEQWERLTL